MSINKLISIRNPIVDAMDLCSVDHDKNIPFFTRQAYLAEKEIGSIYQYVTKKEVLTINNCSACLPDDAEYLEIGILGDLGCDCDDLTKLACGSGLNLPNTFGTVANTFLVVDMNVTETGNGLVGMVNFTIQNNKLIFEHNMDGQKITIQYQAVKKDCDGFVEIGQNHVNAIKWFIVYMFYFRKNGKNSLEYGQMNMAKAEWERECSHARAQDAELTPSQRQRIVGMYHNPYSGISLSIGMRTTLGGNYNAL